MNPIYNTYKPPGFHTVTSYLIAKEATPLLDFLKAAFYATELQRTVTPDGRIANVILQIGDSCFMVGESDEETKAMLLLYVNDPDALYERALAHGATSVMAVEDQVYRDRGGGVKDCVGNTWWLSKRLDEEPYK